MLAICFVVLLSTIVAMRPSIPAADDLHMAVLLHELVTLSYCWWWWCASLIGTKQIRWHTNFNDQSAPTVNWQSS